jgi:hypothetical protein
MWVKQKKKNALQFCVESRKNVPKNLEIIYHFIERTTKAMKCTTRLNFMQQEDSQNNKTKNRRMSLYFSDSTNLGSGC